MKKQDVVEFLWDRLKPFLPKNYTIDESIELLSILEQAKSIHQKEHGETWDESMDNCAARGGNDMRAWADFNEYYNETFGGKQ